MTKLSTQDIDDLYAHLLRASGRAGAPLSRGTVHRVHVVLHRALAQATRWGWVFVNPASTASPPALEPADIRPPSAEEVQALLDSVADDADFATYLRLAVSTGARRSQLLALRWAGVNFERAAIGFTRALVEGPSGPVLRPTKNRRSYGVALDAVSLAALRDHLRRAMTRNGAAGAALMGESFVFSSDDAGATPWKPNWVTKRFIRARRRAGLAHFRLHDLRHFMATTMLAAGVPVPTVAARLSHARASTTLNVYAHVVPGADREAAELLSKLLARRPQDEASQSRDLTDEGSALA